MFNSSGQKFKLFFIPIVTGVFVQNALDVWLYDKNERRIENHVHYLKRNCNHEKVFIVQKVRVLIRQYLLKWVISVKTFKIFFGFNEELAVNNINDYWKQLRIKGNKLKISIGVDAMDAFLQVAPVQDLLIIGPVVVTSGLTFSNKVVATFKLTDVNISRHTVLHVDHTELVDVNIGHFDQLWEVLEFRLFSVSHHKLLQDGENAETVREKHVVNVININGGAGVQAFIGVIRGLLLLSDLNVSVVG